MPANIGFTAQINGIKKIKIIELPRSVNLN